MNREPETHQALVPVETGGYIGVENTRSGEFPTAIGRKFLPQAHFKMRNLMGWWGSFPLSSLSHSVFL